jgi:hypothetical protein
VNGSIGTVKDILWDTGQDPSVSMLLMLLVYFSEYTGPDFPLYGSKTILIFPAVR